VNFVQIAVLPVLVVKGTMMTAKEIVSKAPLTPAELDAVKKQSPKVRAYTAALEQQGLKFEVIKLTQQESEEISNLSDKA